MSDGWSRQGSETTQVTALRPKPISRLEALKARLQRFLARKEIQLLLVVLFGVASMWIALYGDRIQPFQVLSDDEVALLQAQQKDTEAEDLPILPKRTDYVTAPQQRERHPDTVGGPASRDIQATHTFKRIAMGSYDIEARRRDASARVHPIWTYDPTVAVDINTRVLFSFNLLRSALCNEIIRVDDATPDKEATTGDETETADAAKDQQRVRQCAQRGLSEGMLSKSERVTIGCNAAMLNRLRDRLQFPELSEKTCQSIVENGASIEMQRALQNYISDLMLDPIVADETQYAQLEQAVAPLRPATERGFRLIRRAETQTDKGHGDLLAGVITDITNFHTLARVQEMARSGTDVQLETSGAGSSVEHLRELAAVLIQPNTAFDTVHTNAAREQAMGRIINDYEAQTYHRGEVILPQGGIITGEIAETITQMNLTAPKVVSVWWEAFSLAIVLGLVILSIWWLSRDSAAIWSTRDITMMGLVLVVQIGLIRLGFFLSDLVSLDRETQTLSVAILAAMPFAAGSLIVKTLTTTRNAVAFTLLNAILVASMADYEFTWFACALVSGCIAAPALGTAERRGNVVRGAAAASGVVMLLVIAFGARGLMDGALNIVMASAAALIALIATSVVALSIPFMIEIVFRYMTPSTLHELASTAHPLRLQMNTAPGTMMHSDAVAELTSAAASAINANALLARVGAIYHDVGKTRAPEFFGENNIIPNPHDEISYRESAKRIIAHVSDGVELARRYSLPEEIIDFIRTHHGTMAVKHFYNRACKDEGTENVDMNEFRYPGPLPSTKETAICLMADGLEAAVRANPDKSPETIAATVRRMLGDISQEGQLSESGLTLAEVQMIEKSFIQTLRAIHHSRPVYQPAVPTKTEAPVADDADAPRGT